MNVFRHRLILLALHFHQQFVSLCEHRLACPQQEKFFLKARKLSMHIPGFRYILNQNSGSPQESKFWACTAERPNLTCLWRKLAGVCMDAPFTDRRVTDKLTEGFGTAPHIKALSWSIIVYCRPPGLILTLKDVRHSHFVGA